MRVINDFTGLIFGRLTVLKRSELINHKDSVWDCVCECGNTTVVLGGNLRRGTSKSCGCLQKEKLAERSIKHGSLTNGERPPEYRNWISMKTRCNNPLVKEYPLYGGRGIKVCDKWNNSFEEFFKDMGKRPSMRHSLDRFPDNNGNYEPGNVRWATTKEQSRNRRSNNIVEYEGIKMTLMDWAIKFKVPQATLDQRLRRVNSVKKVFDFSKIESNKGKRLI